MNFGKWIVVAFILFAVFIGTLVTVCVKQDVNLVSKDYYKEELRYQDQIDRINNTKQLVDKPHISKVNGKLEVAFGQEVAVQKGELKLFCPSNPKMDQDYQISVTDGNTQNFEIASLQPGMYKAKLLWTMGGKEYFLEEIIYI
jgi:hypothetical protein